MRITAIQSEFLATESPDVRLSRIVDLVAANAVGADLVVLPELWPNGGFSYDAWDETAQPLDGPLVHAMAACAQALGSLLHMGSFVERHNDGSLTNTSLLFDGAGEVIATYRKLHLFGFGEGEPVLMSAGKDVVVARTSEANIGMSTCYDLRFPEMYRRLLDDGADLFVIPAAWPFSRIDHWSVLARARAIENQCVVAAVNTAGVSGRTRMGGRSVVVDATGHVVAEAGEEEQVLAVDVDLSEVARWRQDFPVGPDRRL